MKTIGYRIDIDGTIAEPKHHAPGFWNTARPYIEAGLVTEAEVRALKSENHQRLWLLPQILLTHTPVPGAIQGVKELAQSGGSLEYFTVRQALDTKTCEQVHENTRLWLASAGFPVPRAVQFFWDAGDKLTQALAAPEDAIALIDDRPGGLLKAYQRIRENNPEQAEAIRKRVILIAFGPDAMEDLPCVDQAPGILALEGWSRLSELLSSLGEKFIDNAPTPSTVVYRSITTSKEGDSSNGS